MVIKLKLYFLLFLVLVLSSTLLSQSLWQPRILGESTSSKLIKVDLTTQSLYLYENGQVVNVFATASGTYDRTPNGTFHIWAKIRSQKMSGGSKEKGNYYYLPNVPYILFFYNDQYPKKLGYSIHGAYWHNKFGQPMSHGCVNLSPADAKVVYDWVDMDTPIEITGKYQSPTKNSI